MINNQDIRVFGLGSSQQYAEEVCDILDLPLADHRSIAFQDSEVYIKSSVNVRGKDVFITSSLYGEHQNSAGEKLTELLLFIGSPRQ